MAIDCKFGIEEWPHRHLHKKVSLPQGKQIRAFIGFVKK